MEPQSHQLENGKAFQIREAEPEDAEWIIDHVNGVSGESDFLSMGEGDFDISENEEKKIIQGFREADNQLFLIGLIDGRVIATLSFTARNRPRIQHTGSFGMAVRKEYWGYGIGGLMIDALIAWAKEGKIITKIGLHVRPTNIRGIRLYLSRGFIVEGKISRAMQIDGIYHDTYLMGLEID